MQPTLLLLIGLVFGFSACNASEDGASTLNGDLLSGTSTKLVIDESLAASGRDYFYHFGEVPFPSSATAAQHWGPQQFVLTYKGLQPAKTSSSPGSGFVFGDEGTQGDVTAWFLLLPQDTAAGLTRKYRINAKLRYNVLQAGGLSPHATLAVGCVTRYPTPEIPVASYQNALTRIDHDVAAGWNGELLQVVSEPLKLDLCLSDVFLSFHFNDANGVQIYAPEIQLLAVTEG